MIESIKNFHPDFILGVILIIINFPLGWIGLVWFVHLAKTKCKKIYYVIGIIIYAISWLMLFFGVFLCGKEYADSLFKQHRILLLVLTILLITGLIIFSRYFAKKDSKINKKCLIDKKG